MVFSSFHFLFFFLPALLLCYFLIPQKLRAGRNLLLLAFRISQLHRLRAIGRSSIGLDALLLSAMMLMDALVLLGCFLTVVQRA